MSERNVEIARRWLESLSREDFDVALALLHPDVELVPPGGQAPHRGIEGLRRWMEPDAFPGQVIDPLELIANFDQDRLIRRVEIYLEHEEDLAREAAGLAGSDRSAQPPC